MTRELGLDTYARKRKDHYANLVRRLKDKLQAWMGNMLSFRGKKVLISCFLKRIPIHVLCAIIPPTCVLKELHIIYVNDEQAYK